jgi:hypothetical protein
LTEREYNDQSKARKAGFDIAKRSIVTPNFNHDLLVEPSDGGVRRIYSESALKILIDEKLVRTNQPPLPPRLMESGSAEA